MGRARVSAASRDDLPALGRPDEADVGEQLQPQLEPALLARQAVLGEARRLAGRALEARVAAPALAAVRDDQALPLDREVAEQRPVLVAHLGADGHVDEQVLAVGAVTLRALAVPARAGAHVRLVIESVEVAHLARGDEDDVTTARAVAAVGAALGDVLLAPEADAAVAAASAARADLGPVGEHGSLRQPGGGPDGRQDSEMTVTKRPAALELKPTRPLTLAKMVWSTPMPAPSPARNLRPTLADDDGPGRHDLPGEHLDAEALGLGVAPVAAGAGALLMRHPCSPSRP